MSLFRNLLIERKRKPYYCEVEYLESTGTQWIDTGINVDTSTDEIKLYFQLIDTSLYKWFFGEYDTNARIGLGSGDGTDKRNFLYQQSATKVSDTQMYDKQHLFEINSNGGFLDGTKIRDYVNFASISTIYLFNLNIDSASDYRCKSKIWKYEHKRNGVLIRDIVGVLDWNMTPCMYDKVTRKLFYNKGTGDFLYGREIHPVEYLESTGTQYIDTGVKLTNNHSVELDYQLTQATQSRIGLFGALNMTGSNQGRFGSILSPSNQQLEHGYGAGNDYWQQGLPDTNRHKIYQKKNETYFDGTLIHTFDTATFSLVINAYLGNFVYTNYTPAKAKYYSSKWWDGTTLVRDYKPAIDENGVGFMFDRTTHTIFDNVGTGNFNYPPVELDYLEGTGTQYIDTGLDYFADFEVGIKLRTSVSNKVLGNGAFYCMQRYNSSNPYWQFTNGTSSISYNTTVPITEHHVMRWKDNKIYADDVLLTNFTKDLNASNRMYLFGVADNAKYPNMIYFCKLWNPDDGVLVRELIPCFKDGSAGMWDKVNNVFYSNAGTGNFVAGKVIESKWF